MPDQPTAASAQRKMGLTMIVLAWLVLLGLMAFYFDDWLGEQTNPNQTPSSHLNGKMIEVTLLPNRQHHYVVDGKINGQTVTFMLDTGATDVVVPAPVAHQLGLSKERSVTAYTANGKVAVYTTMINTLEIGDIHLTSVPASINPAMSEPVVLLGMSALRQIEFSQRGDMLILRQ